MSDLPVATRDWDRNAILKLLREYAQVFHAVPAPAIELLEELAKLKFLENLHGLYPSSGIYESLTLVRAEIQKKEAQLANEVERLHRELKQKLESMLHEIEG